MKRVKDKNDISHIGGVIKKLLGSYRQGADEGLVKIWDLWDQAVGEAIARNARPWAFKGKLLLVNVSSSTWAHQLQFLKEDIIKAVNNALGSDMIEEIKFKIGPV